MGEKQNESFHLCFNGFLKVGFQGSRVTSDGGLVLVRELDEHLGVNQLIEQHLTDPRRGNNTQLPLADLLRQSVYSRLAGYEDVNDAERLSQDPTFRLIGSEKTGGRLNKHALYYWLLVAEGHLTRRVFAAILRRIWALPLPAG